MSNTLKIVPTHTLTPTKKKVAREREAPRASEDSVRVDPICDVEFEGGMYRIVQLLDKVRLVCVFVCVCVCLGRKGGGGGMGGRRRPTQLTALSS